MPTRAHMVIRTSHGAIRRMAVSACLRRERAGGKRHELHELARMELAGEEGTKPSSRASGSMLRACRIGGRRC